MLIVDDIRKTRVYQEFREEARLEAKLEIAFALFKRDFPIEEIAEIVELDIEMVRQAMSEGNSAMGEG